MRTIAIAFATLLLTLSKGYALEPMEAKLPVHVQAKITNAGTFDEIATTKKLPSSILKLCANKMAEPGGEWEATDNISNRDLPMSRLIWAAKTGVYTIVHYETGGIAHRYRYVIAETPVDPESPSAAWEANVWGGAQTRDQFIAEMKAGKIKFTPIALNK